MAAKTPAQKRADKTLAKRKNAAYAIVRQIAQQTDRTVDEVIEEITTGGKIKINYQIDKYGLSRPIQF